MEFLNMSLIRQLKKNKKKAIIMKFKIDIKEYTKTSQKTKKS